MIVALFLSAGCAGFGKCGFGECPADARITTQVRSLLGQSPALGAPNLVSIQTVNGVVYLRGIVSTPAQIETAGALARQAPGVISVENLLSIDNSR
jgi:osmotically-inducible protein OsmY